jgi:2C-methyl-D-erythritol 2,4-cyclodiphosphate synthase
MLIGQGIDAHRFEPGRRLVLGGVEIPMIRASPPTPMAMC